MYKESSKTKKKSYAVYSMLIRQVVSAAIFFSVIYGMHCSNNTAVSGCAEAIGRAIRYESDFAKYAADAAIWFREKINPLTDKNDTGITFQ